MIFLDEEVITIYLFGVMNGYSKVKAIYSYTARHLLEWFPNLPSYEGFNYRLNKISHLFEELVGSLLQMIPTMSAEGSSALMDSMPIILAHRGRRFKVCVAQEIATPKGYCSTKKLHYYGVKLHMIGQYQSRSLPLPRILGITDAGAADIKVLDIVENFFPAGWGLFADKAYQKGKQPIAEKAQITVYMPVKKRKKSRNA